MSAPVIHADLPTPGAKGIPGFDDYVATEDGDIWSKKGGAWMKLRAGIGSHGYPTVALCRNGTKTYMLVHRAVCFAFYGPPQDPSLEVRHLDGSRTNNRVENLRWGTHAENCADTRAHGRFKTKLTEDSVRRIREAVKAGAKLADLAAEFDVAKTTIHASVSGQNWSRV